MTASIPVLMYHHVQPNPGMISSSVENFESQLQWLKKRGYQSLTLEEFSQHLSGEKSFRKGVLITFDDGYLNNWVYAFPLLKKYGFKATIFLVTSWLHEGPARPKSDDEDASLPFCPEHHECERQIEAGNSDDVILRWSEVLEMQHSGLVEFHSHTHTHTRWDLIEPNNKNARMKWELAESRNTLQQHLGATSEHLCWPQGYFDNEYIAIAKKAGFNYLYTTEAFGRNTTKTSPTHIHRFAVRNRPGKTLGKRIRASHNPIYALFFNNFKNFIHAQRAKRQQH